jgi:hypothetical protein
MSFYASTSPYAYTSFTDNYLETLEFREIPYLTNDVEYEILAQHNNRPDLLAYDLYGDSRLWWVFAARNKDIIKDPIYDLYAGQRIKLPQINTLKEIGL